MFVDVLLRPGAYDDYEKTRALKAMDLEFLGKKMRKAKREKLKR